MPITSMSAIDIALWDLAGKQLGLPVYKLLGGARTDRIRPYATCYPGDIYDASTGVLVGAQLVGRPFHDHHVLDLAATIESFSPTIGTFVT